MISIVISIYRMPVKQHMILKMSKNKSFERGDRMDTDIIAGIETGLDTALVLSGVSSRRLLELHG